MGYFLKNRQLQSGSSGVVLPTGGSATRPDNAAFGMIRYNTDTGFCEFFNGTLWQNMGVGGVISYTVDNIPTDGTSSIFTMSQAVANVQQITVFVGSIYQDPFTSYTVNGGYDITFTSTPPDNNTINIIHSSNQLAKQLITGKNMGISFVSGSMLNSNLERTTDLGFSGNLLYIDYTGNTVGINTSSPSSTFEVVGNITVGNILISNVGNISAGNVNINNVVDPVQNQDAATKYYVDQATGNIGTAGNLNFSNTTISTSLANGNITLSATGNSFVQIGGTYGLVLPVGTTAERLSSGNITGTVRFNTDTATVEVYDGTEWDQIVSGVTNQTLNGNSVQTDFTLNRSTTTAAVLIMLNGVVQLPGTAYNMTPNPSTNLVFTEAPSTSDVIDIRFL